MSWKSYNEKSTLNWRNCARLVVVVVDRRLFVVVVVFVF
jgi:hypothetical protein